jgi:hypothetical protein
MTSSTRWRAQRSRCVRWRATVCGHDARTTRLLGATTRHVRARMELVSFFTRRLSAAASRRAAAARRKPPCAPGATHRRQQRRADSARRQHEPIPGALAVPELHSFAPSLGWPCPSARTKDGGCHSRFCTACRTTACFSLTTSQWPQASGLARAWPTPSSFPPSRGTTPCVFASAPSRRCDALTRGAAGALAALVLKRACCTTATAQTAGGEGRAKWVATFVFHPVLPFALSVLQSVVHPQQINAHFRWQ